MLVGSAFDYLLRFELKRRDPQAVEREWGAESALTGFMPEIEDDLYHEMMHTLGQARSAEAKFRKIGELTDDLLLWTARLAPIEWFGRSHQIKPDFYKIDPEDVTDLRQLYQIIPPDIFQGAAPVLLNPVFPGASALVRGADCDLIVGDMLVEFKTTQSLVIKPEYWAQLLGYALLADRERESDPTFPKLDRVGIYFCRHGLLWTYPLASIFGDERFPAFREFFWQEAARQFGILAAKKKPRPKLAKKAAPPARPKPKAKPAAKKRIQRRGQSPKRRARAPRSG